jgi:mediator of RNA polymerase II transcription subunit 12, fungi type
MYETIIPHSDQVHGAGDRLNPSAFPLFLDTYMYLMDGRLDSLSPVPDLTISCLCFVELAIDTKANPSDIFRNYPQIHLAELPADMPTEYRQQLRCLLPYPPPHEGVADLVYASLDPSGQTVPGHPVINRPWDWVECLGDNAPGDAPTEGGIRNNASLSLELFAARATGDSVRSEKNPRGFHDALSSESVFGRDWAETRIPLTDESSARREEEDTGVLQAIAAARRGMSPASPAWSRQSAASSRLQSPTQQSLTRGSTSRSDEPPDVERSSVGSRQPGKRKASSASVGSDIEIIESPPTLKKARVSSKAKASNVKPRGRRK